MPSIEPTGAPVVANPSLHHPQSVDRLQILAVVGMQSSGTSVTAGMLQEQGVYLGDVEDERYNQHVKGRRENEPLITLGGKVLRFSGGSWSDPPRGPLRYTAEHVEQRNEILSTFTHSPCAFKAPDTLLLLDFWRDVPLQFIGVIRNPVSAARSLSGRTRRRRRHWRKRLYYLRTRRRPPEELSFDACLRLWKIYNQRLLGELRHREFPVINFDDQPRLGDQVRAALGFYGLPAPNSFSFFEAESVSNDAREWRAGLDDHEAIEIWDELESCAKLTR